MLEIFLLIGLCTYVGKVLRAKGRKPLGYQIGVVVGYYGGAFMAGIVYGFMCAAGGSEVAEFPSLVLALLGLGGGLAVSGTVVLFATLADPDPFLAQSQTDQVPEGAIGSNVAYAQEASSNPYAATRYPAG